MDIELPSYYQEYIKDNPDKLINGLPLYSFKESSDGNDLVSANNLFSFVRPDLAKNYLVIRYFEDSALLISKKLIKNHDGDLFKINLEDTTQPEKLNISFAEYIRQSKEWTEKRKTTIENIERVMGDKKFKLYDRASKTVPFKAKDWKVVRSAVHDFIVALVAFRYNERFNAIDVIAFLVTDHPNYEPGHGIRAALNIVFSAAYKIGSSFELRFVDDINGEKIQNIPDSIIEFAKKCNVNLNKKDSIIKHEDGLKIYSHVSGISLHLEGALKPTKIKDGISLQGLCFLSNLRLWETHEIKFVLTNSINPKGLLFGKDVPEDWGKFEAAIQYGRNIIAASKFKNSLETLLEDINGKTLIDSIEDYFIINLSHPVTIDTTIGEESKEIKAGIEYIIIPRVRRFYLRSDIEDDLKYLKMLMKKKKSPLILIYSMEVKNNNEIIEKLRSQSDLIVVVLPVIANEIDEEVIRRMKRAKSLRT